jgi:hypothetical protein
MLLLRIWKIPDSTLDPRTGYADRGFQKFPPTSSQNSRNGALNETIAASYHLISD